MLSSSGSAAYFNSFVILVSLSLCQPSQQAFAQDPDKRVTIHVRNIRLGDIFTKIEQQTGMTAFTVSASTKAREKKASLDADNERLESVLQRLLGPQGYGFTFKGNNFIVYEENKDTAQRKRADGDYNTSVTITGSVADAEGAPVIGATVKIKGKKEGVISDEKGNFTLPGVQLGEILQVSFVGFNTREIVVKGKTILVELDLAVNDLDETVIVGYSTTTRRDNTGNIAVVRAAEIERQPVSNPLQALSGRVPGLQVEQSSGLPGAAVTALLQGINSLRRGNAPLFIIDGVPYPAYVPFTLSDIRGGAGYNTAEVANEPAGIGSMLAFINPADIESITVLKDADATSIYGSRGANGVILITMKKWRKGAPAGGINVRYGLQQVARRLQLLNTEQYRTMRREAFANSGETLPDAFSLPGQDNADITSYDQSRYTDWQKTLIGKAAVYTDVNGFVSGEIKRLNYFAGGGFHRETTVFPGDFSDTRYSLRLHSNYSSANGRLSATLSAIAVQDNNRLMDKDLTGIALTLPPNAPQLLGPDRELNWAMLPNGDATWLNPLALLQQTYKTTTYNVVGNLSVSYRLLPYLTFKTSAGGTFFKNKEELSRPLTSYAPQKRSVEQGEAATSHGRIVTWIVEPQLDFKRKIGKGDLQVLVGLALQRDEARRREVWSSGSVRSDTATAAYAYAAGFCRVHYNWKDTYIGNVTLRRDGSSRFGIANRFHNFWSVGAAWIFSENPWVKDNAGFLGSGKLKASYGTAGNDQIGDYEYLDIYIPVGAQSPYQGITGLMPARLANPVLQWEETRKLSAGLELVSRSGKHQLSATYYRNHSYNQLLDYTVPAVTGFASIARNMAAVVQNTGWEFELNTHLITLKAVHWRVGINLTIPGNKLLSFPGLESSAYANDYRIGRPVDIRRLYRFADVDPQNGYYRIYDKNGSIIPENVLGTIDDKVVNVSMAPELYGGVRNSLSFGPFELDVLLQYVKQMGPAYLGDLHGEFYGLSDNGNQPVNVMQRWKKPGDVAVFQKAATARSPAAQIAYLNWKQSDVAYMDASYLRLKNLALSWKVLGPWSHWKQALDVKALMQAQNLFTITRYNGLDPETRSAVSLPPLRVFTLGITVSFLNRKK
jgi:TonB-linked SusC/RagA family outer membrane protein